MSFRPLIAYFLLGLLVACGKGANTDAAKAASAPSDGPPTSAAPTLLLAPEDVRTVNGSDASQGPVITGSIEPERRADLRAEVSAVVLQVLKENGESVHRGDLLMRLDDTAIRDSLASATEAARASGQAYEQAERQMQRLKTLQAQGMTSTQALEDAEIRRNSAQSELAAAKARVVSARQQLQRTEVRAPFDGVVSERKASAGDTAQVGKELVKVMDPASMRFEGSVSADRMREVQVGRKVNFRVNGYPQASFAGKVKRVDAAANPATRQVEVLVAFDAGNAPRDAPLVAGLYAEGRIEASGNQPPMLPDALLLREGSAAFVWAVRDGKLAKVAVQLGERDARSGEYPLRGGLADGERILRHPASTLVDGQKIEFAKATAGAPALAATPASAGR